MGIKVAALRHAKQAEKLARAALLNPELVARSRVHIVRTMIVGAAIGAGVASALSMVLR